jgi:hypothetical protein
LDIGGAHGAHGVDDRRGDGGLQAGGAFDEPQVSDGSAVVDRSSQLGTSPRELVVQYDAQALGFVSTARGKVRVSSIKE